VNDFNFITGIRYSYVAEMIMLSLFDDLKFHHITCIILAILAAGYCIIYE